jgi:hypothetical protein
VSVTTPSPGGGTSNAINFPIDFSLSADTSNVAVLDLEGTDLIWDSQRNKIYVAVPGAASTKANTITIVDPVAGIIGGSQSTGSNPGTLALSDDGQYLYASIAGDLAVQRFVLPALSPDIKWTLGTDPITQQAYIPVDVKVQPSAAHTVAVIQADQSLENPEVAVYDDGLMRSKISPSIDCNYSSLQWNSGGSGIFSEDTTSDRALCVLSVNASGASFQTSFGMAFRAIGARLHLDSQSGYVYSDPGEVVNTSTGVPVGNNTTHRSSSTSPILSAFDSNLKRVFFISTDQNSSGQNEFLLQVFDQTQFTLLGSFVIPNAVGTPANFIRWGNSGLAFVTNNLNGVNPSSGQLYLLDGPFVNPSGTLDSAIGSALNPVPTLLSVSPLSSEVGGSDVQIRITGRDFAGPPAVYWNNTALTTTLISETEVQAIIPAADLAAVGQASLTVLNSSPGGGSSNFLPFSINPPASASNRIAVFGTGGNDLVWDSTAQKIYVSVPSIQGGLGNTIAIVDPVAGTVSSTPFIGSDPAKLAISSDDQYLYVGLNGANSVQRFILPGLTPDISWHLGADSFDGPYYALDLLAAPGSSHNCGEHGRV